MSYIGKLSREGLSIVKFTSFILSLLSPVKLHETEFLSLPAISLKLQFLKFWRSDATTKK